MLPALKSSPRPPQVKAGARLILGNRGRAVLFAAHQDSPHINLKSRPVANAPGSVALLKTMPCGGIKRYQWANLPMALVGQINTVDVRHIDINIGFARRSGLRHPGCSAALWPAPAHPHLH